MGIGNSRNLYRLIMNTGPRESNVMEVIKDPNDILIHSQKRRIKRWAEHLRDQFSWSTNTVGFPLTAAFKPM